MNTAPAVTLLALSLSTIAPVGCQVGGHFPPATPAPTCEAEWRRALSPSEHKEWFACGFIVTFPTKDSMHISMDDLPRLIRAKDDPEKLAALGGLGISSWSMAQSESGEPQLRLIDSAGTQRTFALEWKSGGGPFDTLLLRRGSMEVMLSCVKKRR